MAVTWESLLDQIQNGVDRMPWRDDNERRDAEIEVMRGVLKGMLELLQDAQTAAPAAPVME